MPSLTVEEFQALVETDLDPALLQLLLDATWESITAALGEMDYNGDHVTYRNGGSRIVFLDYRPAAISGITETVGNTVTALDPDDWLLRSDGVSLERLNNGTNHPTSWDMPGAWDGRIAVTYTLPDDIANEQRVQVGLMQLELLRQGESSTAASFRVGEYSETGSSTAAQSYDDSRAALLASLRPRIAWSFA